MVRTRNTVILILIFFCFVGCDKTEENPCNTFPCGDENNYFGNRVAYNAEFREGTWINVSESVVSQDTIVFHNDSIWSNFYADYFTGEVEGLFNKKYTFNGLYLEFYDGYDGLPLSEPYRKQTSYNDTTGLFSIYRGAIFGNVWDYYIKIE